MTVALIYFFFLSLQVTNSPFVQALKQLLGAAGEDISVTCGITFSGTWKVFCREDCAGGNILIQTRQHTAQIERYSIKYVRDLLPGAYIFSVTISNLNESDSGLYRCGLGDFLSSVIYQDFRLVVEASGSLTSSSDSVHSTFTPTATLSFSYSSGSLPPSPSSETTNQSVLSQEEVPTSKEMSAELLLVVGLVVVGILLSGVLLVFCTKRCHNHHKGTKTTGGSGRTDQQNAVYENYPPWDLIYQNVKPVDRNKK